MDDFSVKVEGLTELRKELRQLGNKGLTTDLKAAHKAAAEVVVRQARTLTPVRSGRARASLRALGNLKGGQVAGGKQSVPYFAWLDFGGRIVQPNRNRTIARPFLRSGRILYRALSMTYDQVRLTYDREVSTVIRKAGLDK